MTTLHNKSDILDLIKTPVFHELLEIDSQEAFLEREGAFPGQQYEYYAGKWDEEGSGVTLFTTPKRSNNCGEHYGTWLKVAKLYGNPELPFRVQAAEYVPWGIEVDLENIGDYRTLGEALDAAFLAHEHGNIELNVVVENEELGRYVQGDNEISVPTADCQSNEAHVVNTSVERITAHRIQEAAARDIRYQAPVSVNDAAKLLVQIKAKMQNLNVEDTTNVRLHLAAAVNKYLFAGQGQLINVVNNDLSHHDVDLDGTTLLSVMRGKTTVLLDVNGVYGNMDEANASIAKVLTEIYKPEITERAGEKAWSVCWFDEEPWEVYMDENTFSSVIEEPELQEDDPLNPYPEGEVEVNNIVRGISVNYKVTRERRYQQSLSSDLTP